VSDLPPTHAAPASTIRNYIARGVEHGALVELLDHLHDKGWQEVQYCPENEPDVHIEGTYTVEAWKRVCACINCPGPKAKRGKRG